MSVNVVRMFKGGYYHDRRSIQNSQLMHCVYISAEAMLQLTIVVTAIASLSNKTWVSISAIPTKRYCTENDFVICNYRQVVA